MNIHYFCYDTEKEMPAWLKNKEYKDYSGTKCGYMRKNKTVTALLTHVTCTQCLKKINVIC